MENGQKINCTVNTCQYNNTEKGKCTLEAIEVKPVQNKESKNPDDSMCASYQYEEN